MQGTVTNMLAAIEAIARDVDGEVYRHYSGRAMYGSQCLGVVCPYASEAIEAAARRGITGARTDSMGRDYIVYWPALADPYEAAPA